MNPSLFQDLRLHQFCRYTGVLSPGKQAPRPGDSAGGEPLLTRLTAVSSSRPPARPACCGRCSSRGGDTDEGLDVVQPIVVEGVLVVIRHPARGEFPAVVELQVRDARRILPGG
jgi:hypothetical protein